MSKQIFHIIRNDLRLDNREKYSFLSSILYLFTVTLVVYKVFGELSSPVSLGIFWILLIFTSINIISHSYSHQAQNRKLNHYQLYNPIHLIIAKLMLNTVKILIAAFLLITLIAFFRNEWPKDFMQLSKIVSLSVIGIVAVMTLVSTISIYSKNQTSLLSLLSFPLLIPILMLGMILSLSTERMFVDTAIGDYFWMLVGIDLVLVTLCIVLIPFTWKP